MSPNVFPNFGSIEKSGIKLFILSSLEINIEQKSAIILARTIWKKDKNLKPKKNYELLDVRFLQIFLLEKKFNKKISMILTDVGKNFHKCRLTATTNRKCPRKALIFRNLPTLPFSIIFCLYKQILFATFKADCILKLATIRSSIYTHRQLSS